MILRDQGLIKFLTNRVEYTVTWGSKAYWCELCQLEGKGSPAEVGDLSLGVFWVREDDPVGPQSRAVGHMIEHVNEG